MMTRDSLERVTWKLRDWIVPGLQHSQARYERSLTPLITRSTRWLDLGCGHRILPEWRAEAERNLVATCKRVIGLDYDQDSVKNHRSISYRLRGTSRLLPFSAETFDLVTANMVVEHLESPAADLQEIRRVLRP